MAKRLAKEFVEGVQECLNKGYSFRETAKILGVQHHTISNVVKRKRLVCYTKQAALQLYSGERTDLTIEPVRERERNAIARKYSGRPLRILSLGDLHCPFQSRAVLDAVYKEKDIDVVVLSEILDFYSLSRFRKDKLISLKEELMEGLTVIQSLKKRFKNVVWFEANHERRAWALLQDRLRDKEDLIELLNISPPVKERMEAEGVDATCSWWVRIGNTIFAHPDWFSNVKLKTVLGTQDYFLKENRALWGSIDCIVNHHTHQLGMTINYGQVLMEAGSGCIRMDYLREGKKRLETQPGYGIIQLNRDGSLDFNNTRLVRV